MYVSTLQHHSNVWANKCLCVTAELISVIVCTVNGKLTQFEHNVCYEIRFSYSDFQTNKLHHED